jgi:hypothetical protein
VAIQWVDVTTPNVPSISGLVVKGSGLMWLMEVHYWGFIGGALDHSRAALPTGTHSVFKRNGVRLV